VDYDQDDAEDNIITTRSPKDILNLVGDEEEVQHYEVSWPNKLQLQ